MIKYKISYLGKTLEGECIDSDVLKERVEKFRRQVEEDALKIMHSKECEQKTIDFNKGEE